MKGKLEERKALEKIYLEESAFTECQNLPEEELSDKHLMEKYKNLKMTDVPPMWEEIERNLAPKKLKKVVPFRRLASLAAVFLAVVVLIPVMYMIQRGQTKDMNSSDGMWADGAAQMDGNNEMEEAANAVGEEKESVLEDKIAEDGAVTEKAEADESVPEENVGSLQEFAAEQQMQNGSLLRLQVEIVDVSQEGNKLVMQAKVLKTANGAYPEGEMISLVYEGTEYSLAAFKETLYLKVQMEREEEIYKILEILP